MMKPELKERWVAALEGPYADKKTVAELKNNEGFCCLGVLIDIEKAWVEGEQANHNYFPLGPMGLSGQMQEQLWELNDENDTFAPVIEYIRKNL